MLRKSKLGGFANLAFGLIALGTLAGACGGEKSGEVGSTGGPAAGAGASALPPEKRIHPPKRGSGSAAALSDSGTHVYIADEDHEVLFVVPTMLSKAAETKVVKVPGPPAQVVSASDLVLVTVRTLPTEEAKNARAEIIGPTPTSAGVRPLFGVANRVPALFLNKSEFEKFAAESSLEAVEKADLAAAASAAATAAGAPSASGQASSQPAASASASASASAAPTAKPSANASAKPGPTPPPKLFDPLVVRQSQGGLLLIMKPDPEKGLVEMGRIALPADAWGLGVTPDGKRAIVTSAWTAQVSVVDINTQKVIKSFPTHREPRGVTITSDGKTAYISHIIGSQLTKLESLDGEPTLSKLDVPTAPSRTPSKTTLTANLSYATTLSPDGRFLYLPRHAMGAEGRDAWWGSPTVDVFDLKTSKNIAPVRMPGSPGNVSQMGTMAPPESWMVSPGRLPGVVEILHQPRAVVYRKKTDTLLVASEGEGRLVELSALAPDPALFVKKVHYLAAYDDRLEYELMGGAPSGIALSEDEDTAFVYCRSTFDIAKVNLKTGSRQFVRLAEDPLPQVGAIGRRLFSNSFAPTLSGGTACSTCHPEGREDGYVWREVTIDEEAEGAGATFIALKSNMKEPAYRRMPDGGGMMHRQPGDPPAPHKYYPRQTPMIAGRLRADGPYGWHAEAPTIVERLQRGILLHKPPWFGGGEISKLEVHRSEYGMIKALAYYVQSALLPPPVVVHPLTDQEKRGKEIFENDENQCARCHIPTTDWTDRTAYPLKPLPVLPGFDAEKNSSFKTPSLLFVAGTAPYFHDGSQPTLEDLIKNNGSRMGHTEKLSPEDQAALVAYLKTL
ncbi:MAG: hypothetical protein IPK82_37030 [Polyangiaceae bacterium]|nr:hypothetical protein [Polyangiaceae bacterium]